MDVCRCCCRCLSGYAFLVTVPTVVGFDTAVAQDVVISKLQRLLAIVAAVVVDIDAFVEASRYNMTCCC